MANQQLIDWIKQEESRGYTPQQLYSSLIQQGYNSEEVNEAIRIASFNTDKGQEMMPSYSKKPVKPKISLSIILIVLAVVALVIGGLLFYDDLKSKDKKELISDTDNLDRAPEKTADNATQDEGSKDLSGCESLPDKLDACEIFSCKFMHPFTGELMEKKITGLIDGKCGYSEEMPNGGMMECSYSESLRKAVAAYYRDISSAGSAKTSARTGLDEKGLNEKEITYTIDGKEVSNPLQEALDGGQCTISGY